jgi:hypothetical protein
VTTYDEWASAIPGPWLKVGEENGWITPPVPPEILFLNMEMGEQVDSDTFIVEARFRVTHEDGGRAAMQAVEDFIRTANDC